MSDQKRWILPVSGGILASIAWWGAPVIVLLICFVPLLIVEDDVSRQNEHPVSLLPFSFAFFFFWNLIVCWWMARIHLAGGLAVIFINAVLMSLVFMLFSVIKRKTGGTAFSFVVLWTAFEFLHYHGDLSWPWLSLGNGLAGNIKLIQWYEYTGTTGGSLWVLVVNTMVFSIIKSLQMPYRRKRIIILASLLLLITALPAAFSYYLYHSYIIRKDPVEFLIIQPGLDPYEDKFSGKSNEGRADQMFALAGKKISNDTRYIISPETAVDSIWITGPPDPVNQKIQDFINNYPGKGMLVGATTFSSVPRKGKTFTSRVDDDGTFYDIYNSALLFVAERPPEVYHKHYLANGVEQVPFQSVLGFMDRLFVDAGGISGGLKKGPGREVFKSPLSDSTVIGPLICFESAYGEYAAGLTAMGAEILVIISNDGWFKNTGAYRQHLRLSQIRAVETRRSVVRAANTGISCHIAATGQITEQTDWWEEAVLEVTANKNDRITIFTVYGDYPGRISLFFSGLMLLNLLAVTILRRKTYKRL